MRVVIDMVPDASGGKLTASGFEPRAFLPGGEQNMYELAFAAAALGYETELRGFIEPHAFRRMRDATTAAPAVELPPRRPRADDLVIVPEGWRGPLDYLRLMLSPARLALFVLAAPGLFGWPFADGAWEPPDPITVDLDEVARPETFRRMRGAGFRLLTHSPGIVAAAEGAGVPCALVGVGRPSVPPAPAPDAERPVDVAALLANRWRPLVERVATELDGLTVDLIEETSNEEMMRRLARARVLLWPSRIEGHATIPWEARTVGCVPVALSSNRFAVGLDEPAGAIAVDDVSELPAAIRALLADAPRRQALSERAVVRSREDVSWTRYLERVGAFLEAIPDEDPAAGARGALGAALLDADRRAVEREIELGSELARVVADRDAVAADRDRAQYDREWYRAELGRSQDEIAALVSRRAVRAVLKLDGMRQRVRAAAATTATSTATATATPADRWAAYLAEVEPALAAQVRVHRFAQPPILAASAPPAAAVAVWIDGEGPDAQRTRDALTRSTVAPATVMSGGGLRDALQGTRCDHVAIVRAGDILAPVALQRLGEAISLAPDAHILTCDEDELGPREERRSPRLRPGPSPDRWLACDDSGSLLVVARAPALERTRTLGEGPGARHALALALAGPAGERHAHVPLLLVHRDARGGPPPGADLETIAAVLGEWEPDATITQDGELRRVRRPLRGEPLVQVIVCLRDHAELTARCVDSLLTRTAYDHLSLTLVDNGSVEASTAQLLSRLGEDRRVTVRRDDRPFNFAALNNGGVGDGDLLVFLNNDTEITDPDWVTVLAEEAQRPEVGAVAPMLVYPDGAVQHAGAALGLHGYAGHPFAGLTPQTLTPFGRAAQGTRNWLAVTAACTMVRRDAFQGVGGFDERFVVAGNDVDLCLRLTAAGHRSLCVSRTTVVHDESRSRGTHIDPADFAASESSYGLFRTVGDPFYNPSLSLVATDCRLRAPGESP